MLIQVRTANPDWWPFMAEWIILRRNPAIDRSRRAFIRANWPCRGLRLCIPFLLGRHAGDQLLKTSVAEIVIPPRAQLPVHPGTEPGRAAAFAAVGHQVTKLNQIAKPIARPMGTAIAVQKLMRSSLSIYHLN